MGELSEATVQEIESLCNHTIHEMVFVFQFSDQGDLDEARDAITAAQLNLQRITDLLSQSTATNNEQQTTSNHEE